MDAVTQNENALLIVIFQRVRKICIKVEGTFIVCKNIISKKKLIFKYVLLEEKSFSLFSS